MRNWTTIKEFEEIKFEYFEGIAKITINRPRYRNAFTPDTIKEMIEAMVFYTYRDWETDRKSVV